MAQISNEKEGDVIGQNDNDIESSPMPTPAKTENRINSKFNFLSKFIDHKDCIASKKLMKDRSKKFAQKGNLNEYMMLAERNITVNVIKNPTLWAARKS